MKSRIPHSRRTFSLAASLALLVGCGGGGTGNDPVAPAANGIGRLTVSVAWPETTEPGRVVPANALSIRIELLKNGSPFRSLLLAKPVTEASFTELPLGAISVRATAFPTANGTGNALATTTVAATVAADTQTTVPVTMASTVASLVLSPATLNLAQGASQTITVAAKNAAGGAVLIPVSAVTYTSNAPALVRATKNADGTATLTHLAGVGTAIVTVTESASGKSTTLPVTVQAAVSVTPASATFSVSTSGTFVATVLGPANTAVTWSVQEANGGTVTAGGVYTSPATKGTYHVVATSVADPSRKAIATVIVKSGAGSVIVN